MQPRHDQPWLNLDTSVLLEVSRTNDAMTKDRLLGRVFPEIRITQRARKFKYLNHSVDVREGGAGVAAALLQAEVRAELPERGQELRLLRDVGAAALADPVAQLERLVEARLEVLQVGLGLREQPPEGRRVREALVDGDDERHRELFNGRSAARRGEKLFYSYHSAQGRISYSVHSRYHTKMSLVLQYFISLAFCMNFCMSLPETVKFDVK